MADRKSNRPIYDRVYDPKHFPDNYNKKGPDHVRIAQTALGRLLPPMAVVHHVNGDKHDNANPNLVICQNQKYHLLLHSRLRVLRAGGNPNTQKICSRCKAVKSRPEFGVSSREYDGLKDQCRSCRAIVRKEYAARAASGLRKTRAKLTVDDVRSIKASMSGSESLKSIARRFGVGYDCIRHIRAGITWVNT